MPKINYLKFSQNIKSQYPEYKDWNDLELAEYFVAQEPRYSQSVDFGDLKKKDQAAPSLGEQGGLQYASTGDPIADKAQTQSALKSYSQKKDKSEEIGFWENIGNNIINGSNRMWNDFTQTGYEFGMISRGVPIAGAQALSKTARPFYENYKTKTRQEMGLLEESAAAFANSIPIMVASIGIGGVAGAGAKVAGTLPAFISGFQEGGKEADELGITDPLDRLTFQAVTANFSAASELIMPDASLVRPLRQRALKEVVRVGAKGFSKADAGRYIAEFTEKVGKEVGEEYAVEIGNALRNASFAAAGYDRAAPEMKSARDYAVMTLSAALGAGTFAGVGTGVDAAFAKSTAIKKAAENPEAAAQAAADLVDAGTLTQEQADAFLAKVASVNKAIGKMPDDVDPDVAVNTADLLNEKVGLEETVKELEENKKRIDPSFHQGIDDRIAQITARINELTQQITEFQAPTINLDVERIDQAAPEAPQMAPAEVSPEVGMEVPQAEQAPQMAPLEDLEFDNIEFIEPVITPVETQLVGEKKSPLIKEAFPAQEGVKRPRRKPGEVRTPLMEQVTEGGVFKAKLRDSRTGTEFIIEDPELSLDLAIAAQVKESGRTAFPQPAFLEAFNEVIDADPELQTLFPNISETGQPLALEQKVVSLDGKKVTRNVVQRMQPIYGALEQRMENAEEIPMSEIESVVDQIIQAQQEIQGQEKTKTIRAANGARQEFTPLNEEQKRIFNDFTESLVNKLLSYEFATITTTGPTAQKTTAAGLIATPREGKPLQESRVQREKLDGAEVTVEGRGRGRISIKPLPGLGERSVYGITFEEVGAQAPETISPTTRETGTTPAAVGVEPQTEQDVRQETNAPQEGRGQGEDVTPVPQEEGRQEGQVTPPAVAQEGETPPATGKKTRKTEQQKADEGKAILDKLKETLRSLKAKPGGGANIDLTFGIVPITKAVWNTAIDTAILAIDAGQSLSQAVKAASDYISSRIDGDWGKAKFEQYLGAKFADSGLTKEEASIPQEGDISVKDVKVVKGEDFKFDAEWEVRLGDRVIGRLWYDRSIQFWMNTETMFGPGTATNPFKGILGSTKEEAIEKLVDDYNKSEKAKETKVVAQEVEERDFSNDKVLNRFLNRLSSLGGLEIPFFGDGFVYNGKALVEFDRFDKGDRNEVALRSIMAIDDTGKGVGSEVMSDITSAADELGTKLTLYASPFGTKAMSPSKLVSFYKKFGFTIDLNDAFGGDFSSEESLLEYLDENPGEGVDMVRAPQAQSKSTESVGLSKRLSGDALLNAQDLLEELSNNGAEIDEDGMVTVYHRTSSEKKSQIEESGKMTGLEDGVFFSTKETGQAEGYGKAIVKLKIPVEELQIDDTFGNEAHVRIPTAKAKQEVDVSSYLRQAQPDTKVETGEDVARIASEMQSDQGFSDFTLRRIASEDYTRETASIDELRKNDPSLEEYIAAGEMRETAGTTAAVPPIVSSNGEVIDGYNRILQAAENGEKSIEVMKGRPKAQPEAQVDVAGTAKERRDKFFDEIEGMYRAFPFQPGLIVSETPNKNVPLKDVKILGRLSVYEGSNDGSLYIDEVQAQNFGERTGNGSKIMQIVSDMADKYGLTIELVASPIYGNKMTGVGKAIAKALNTPEKLAKFYEKFGFVNVADNLGREEYSKITKELKSAGFSTVNPIIPPSRQLLMVRPPKAQQQAQPEAQVEATARALEGVDENSVEIDGVSLKDATNDAKDFLGEGLKMIMINGKDAGAILLEEIDDEKNVVKSVFVEEKQREKGIAKRAYLISAIINGDVKSGEFRNDLKKTSFVSNDARKLWESLNRDFNVKKIPIQGDKFRYSLTREAISDAYQKAKADGSNPKLVQAVDKLLGRAVPEAKPAKTIAEQRKEFRETAKKYFDGLKKMGIAFDPEGNSKEDIAFLKALAKYIKLELDNGMVTFKGFLEKTSNIIEGFNEAAVVEAAKEAWAKEVVKAYPKLYAKYSAAKRKELEREIKDIKKTMIRKIREMTDPKIVNFKSQLKTEKRRLSKEAAAQLAAINNAYDAKTMMAMEPQDLMELMNLTEGIYKEGRSEIKALNESLDEAAQIQGEEMLAAVTSKDKRLDKLSDKEAARRKLKFKSGVVVAVNNDERVILKEEAELDALTGEGYNFFFLNTTGDKVVNRGFLDSVASFFSGKLRTINENARDLRTALELIKSKSKESQDFINGLVAKMNKASVTKARKSEEWSSILKDERTKFFGPDIKFGYTNWMNAIAKVDGKALELIDGRGEPIGPINNGKIVSLYRQLMDPTNLVKTDNVRKINLSDESIQSIIDYMNLPANKPGKDFALSLTKFFLQVAKDTKAVLENNGYNSTKLDEKRYNTEDFEGDEFIAQVMGQFADTRTEGFIPYTPIQATESPDTIQGVEINEDDLLNSGDLQKNFSVISNNMITRRPGGVIVPTDIRQTLNAYTAGMANMNAKLPLLRETQSVFSKRNLTAMSNAFAPQFTENLKANYISFMTDRVTPVISNKTEAAIKTWLMTSTAIPMFLNPKTGLLQLLGGPNFIVSYDLSKYIDASKKLLSDGALFKETILEIINLPIMKQRYGGRFSPDSRVISEEMSKYGKVAINIPFTNLKISAKELLSKGYIFSSIGDVFAIAFGGAPIYYDIVQTNKKKYMSEGMSALEAKTKAKQDAEEKLFEIIQETQQSSEAMYLSQFQKQSITRIFSSFATSTMQYYRKARRAAARMKNKEGNQLQNAYEILHYTAINAAVFQFFSSMFVDWLSGPGEDELEEMSREERMDFVRYMEDVMATVAQGTGALGVALQALILAYKESEKSGKPEKIVESALRTMPAVRMKYDAAINTLREWKRGDYVRSLTRGAELANIPADRIRSLGLQVSDALMENLDAQERIARLMGFRTESWMREKKQGEIWNGVQSTIDKSTPAERQRAISNTKSAYRDLFQLYGKRYAEATTEAEKARVDSIASKELLNVYNHRQGGPELTEELQKLFNQSAKFNSLPKDLQKLKNMETNRKIGDVVEEVLSLEKKSEQKAMEYWSSLVNNGILSDKEIDRIREEYNTRKGLQ